MLVNHLLGLTLELLLGNILLLRLLRILNILRLLDDLLLNARLLRNELLSSVQTGDHLRRDLLGLVGVAGSQLLIDLWDKGRLLDHLLLGHERRHALDLGLHLLTVET